MVVLDGRLALISAFDPVLNRPDILLERIGAADPAMFALLREAWRRRIFSLGFDPSGMRSPTTAAELLVVRILDWPGGARNCLRDEPLRRWPVAHYAALARLLLAAGRKVVLCGGPDDAWVRPHCSWLKMLDAIGRTSIDGLPVLFAACSVVIAYDSGPMHLADLAGARVIALFGPTSPHE